MVTIVGYKTFSKEKGGNFYGLVVQGGIEAIKSVDTGKTYFTARKVTVPTTFDEQTCINLYGTKFEGSIRKVMSSSYDYTVKDTGEVIELNYRYEFVNDEDNLLEMNVIQKELVH